MPRRIVSIASLAAVMVSVVMAQPDTHHGAAHPPTTQSTEQRVAVLERQVAELNRLLLGSNLRSLRMNLSILKLDDESRSSARAALDKALVSLNGSEPIENAYSAIDEYVAALKTAASRAATDQKACLKECSDKYDAAKAACSGIEHPSERAYCMNRATDALINCQNQCIEKHRDAPANR